MLWNQISEKLRFILIFLLSLRAGMPNRSIVKAMMVDRASVVLNQWAGDKTQI